VCNVIVHAFKLRSVSVSLSINSMQLGSKIYSSRVKFFIYWFKVNLTALLNSINSFTINTKKLPNLSIDIRLSLLLNCFIYTSEWRIIVYHAELWGTIRSDAKLVERRLSNILISEKSKLGELRWSLINILSMYEQLFYWVYIHITACLVGERRIYQQNYLSSLLSKHLSVHRTTHGYNRLSQ
jgi:hypothetical protein